MLIVYVFGATVKVIVVIVMVITYVSLKVNMVIVLAMFMVILGGKNKHRRQVLAEFLK